MCTETDDTCIDSIVQGIFIDAPELTEARAKDANQINPCLPRFSGQIKATQTGSKSTTDAIILFLSL